MENDSVRLHPATGRNENAAGIVVQEGKQVQTNGAGNGVAKQRQEVQACSFMKGMAEAQQTDGRDCEERKKAVEAENGGRRGKKRHWEKKEKKTFIYGNYNRYYGYRIGAAFSSDPRLFHLQRRWFEGRDCLDIGCNEGCVSIGIAQRFRVRSMLGVDIDGELIDLAWNNLRRRANDIRKEQQQKQQRQGQQIQGQKMPAVERNGTSNGGKGGRCQQDNEGVTLAATRGEMQDKAEGWKDGGQQQAQGDAFEKSRGQTLDVAQQQQQQQQQQKSPERNGTPRLEEAAEPKQRKGPAVTSAVDGGHGILNAEPEMEEEAGGNVRGGTEMMEVEAAEEEVEERSGSRGLEAAGEAQRVARQGDGGDGQPSVSGSNSATMGAELDADELQQRVTFRVRNIVEGKMEANSFDVVLCLSVSKWVHLNWGDSGLTRLFVRIYEVLRPGGILILEPQPWKSYKSKHNVSEVAKRHFKEIKIKPENFREFLLDKIGFQYVHEVAKSVTSETGFARPIFVYHK